MITKEYFVSLMNKLKNTYETQRKIKEAISEDEMLSDVNDFFSAAAFTCSMYPIVSELLTDIFDDEDNGWVVYWMFELDFGAAWEEGCITEDGNDIKLQTASELYDFLLSNMKTH